VKPLQTPKHIHAGPLDIAYFDSGPIDGPAVFLMHGFPYDVHAYAEVAPLLAAAGCRVIVPYLRGFGPTRFLHPDTPRSGEQAALGADLLALMDALAIPRAVLAGYDGVRPPASAAAHAHRFSGPRSHRVVPGVGHNMPQEVPRVFADAVLELVPALKG
jgi:pimeloyl-ACP methyl ester carboxylesterase